MDKRGIATEERRQARTRLGAFLRNRRGVAAIEFALIAPLLLTLYFVTIELAQGMETGKKVSRIGSMVADLVAQQGRQVNTGELDPIMEIGEAILQPYNRSRADIVITGIEIDKNSNVKVKWSRAMRGGVFGRDANAGDTTTVPAELKIPETFLLRVTAELEYLPILAWTAQQKTSVGLLGMFDHIAMQESYYLRPRMSAEIDCTNC
ncbi:MAG: pilus assembly protein [Hyphomicrobiales bacterium]|nr:MAG: pilus assembly protein [Hyphomicrobiales bacterium]